MVFSYIKKLKYRIECPKQAITLLGNKVIEQTSVEKYL